MDNRPPVWDAANRRHLLEEHPERHLSRDEIDEVLTNDKRLEVPQPERDAWLAIGQTLTGRWLVVAWVDHPKGRYPVHARPAGRRTIRRVTR